MKRDGVRAIAHATPAQISLWSRNLRDITGSYPEIITALAEITEGRTMRRRPVRARPPAPGRPPPPGGPGGARPPA
ncbi:hypothetical protein AB0F86_25875, partial [Nocardia sp. NPDC023733]